MSGRDGLPPDSWSWWCPRCIKRTSIGNRLVDQRLVSAEFAVRDKRSEHLDHHAHPEQRCDVGRIVRGRYLDDFESANALRRHQASELERLARQESAGFRPSRAGHEAAI